MKKIEMELKFAEEIYELDEERYQLQDELKELNSQGLYESANRVRRYKSKVFAKRKQTMKMAHVIGLDLNHIENLAFEISVTKANQEPIGINLDECVPF